jgi:hypothetical protein
MERRGFGFGRTDRAGKFEQLWWKVWQLEQQ